MEKQYLLLDRRDGWMWIKLNRPEVYNSFHRGMSLELLSAMEEASEDHTLRCLVISGKGKAFSAGQDLQEAVDPQGPGLERILKEHFNPLVSRIRSLRMPVIAAVNGVAAGAGANLALACDIVVASDSASFIQAFSKIGLVPDSGGTFFLPRLVGWQRASALMLTGDRLSAEEARQWGMIYKVFPQAQFVPAVEALAQELAGMPTQALLLTRRLLETSAKSTLEEQLQHELKAQCLAGTTSDFQEGVQAFLARRAPHFTGN
ncbi:MAG: enoyl-CoA hydratase/isomerase family protein [Saprospiraceae bacterium]|nr:enoyl-CoA hydratase/isomerase family protein [Saprospiraceae bacterium]